MITVTPYQPAQSGVWNDVVAKSRSGTFLHDRNYMDYHADRFEDASVFICLSDKPLAAFPASRHGDEIVSHGGLTYGGILASADLRAQDTLTGMQLLCDHYRATGARRLVYKAIPQIFHRYPCQEDLYALFRSDARLFRRDLSSVVELGQPRSYSKGRKWSINKARKAGVTIASNDDFTEFHGLLQDVVRKFGVAPTHTLAELTLLRSRFPEQIRLFEARLDGVLLAGTLVFDFGGTVHTQYMAASDEARDIGGLDLLIAQLLETVFADRRYFSFGISTESAGTTLNVGLVAQKEGFGARAVVHDFYEITL